MKSEYPFNPAPEKRLHRSATVPFHRREDLGRIGTETKAPTALWRRRGSRILSGTSILRLVSSRRTPTSVRRCIFGPIIVSQLAKDRQAQARPHREIQPGHLFQRRMQLGIAAGLQRDHEGQRAFLESRLLQHGVNIQADALPGSAPAAPRSRAGRAQRIAGTTGFQNRC